jgi:hypothetical protein
MAWRGNILQILASLGTVLPGTCQKHRIAPLKSHRVGGVNPSQNVTGFRVDHPKSEV